MSRIDFEADIDAYTERLNSRMKEKYRANSHKPLMSEMTDLELQHELEGEFDETMVEVTWAALGRYNLIFKKPPDDLECETADLNNYLCEIWRRSGALEVLEEVS